LNADSIDNTVVGGLLTANLFAYCLNNPVNLTDPDGAFAQLALAGAYGTYLGTAYAAGGANFWNPVGWAILGVAVVSTVAIIGYTVYEATKKPKPVNLPSWKKITLDMEHILSGHGPEGNRGGPNKDRFPWWMTAAAIEKAVKEAYRYGEVLQRQGERVFMRGPWGDSYIEMWVNTATKVIESAWPKSY
jgi:hypothetical protein